VVVSIQVHSQSRRNDINPNLRILERRRQHPAHMRKRRLTRRIRKLPITAPLHRPRNRARVDDTAGVSILGIALALGQQWQEGHGHEEATDDVGLVGVEPGGDVGLEEVLGDGDGVLHVGGAVGGELGCVVAGDAGVVDEEVDAVGLFLRHFFDETWRGGSVDGGRMRS